MAYFKELQRNKRKRINSIKHAPVFHDPTITKQVAVSNTREAGNLFVKEKSIEKERAKSEYQAGRAAKLFVDKAKKMERTTGRLHADDDTKDAIAKWKGRSMKHERKEYLDSPENVLPDIVLSSPGMQRSRFRTWPNDNHERAKSVDMNMNNVINESSNSIETSGFNRKNRKVYDNVGLPTITRKPRATTFTGSLDAIPYEASNGTSLHEMPKDRPRSVSPSIIDILARKKFLGQTMRRSASIGRFEDVISTMKTDDSEKLRMTRRISTSNNNLASREQQAFHRIRSRLLSDDSQPRSSSSSLLSLPDLKFSLDSEDSWPHMDDSVFEDSKKEFLKDP